MQRKKKEPKPSSLENYVFIDQSKHVITKKQSEIALFFTEITVYILIAVASYISLYLATNKFTDEKVLNDSIDLLTKYFSSDNMINTALGIFVVIGILSSFNYITTGSQFKLQHILDRLTHSLLDLVFLMFSSMLGLFFAALEFTRAIPSTPKIDEFRNTLWLGIVSMSMLLCAYTFILVIINENKNVLRK